jgi:predicted small metal-binding protein
MNNDSAAAPIDDLTKNGAVRRTAEHLSGGRVDEGAGRAYTRPIVGRRWFVGLTCAGSIMGTEDHMQKVLKCADVMGDCDTVIVGKDAEEVFAKAEAHARKQHNMTIITPSVMSQIEAAIKDR